MSIEQWGVLALFVLLPLLEGVVRLRRTLALNSGASDDVAQAPTARRRLPLPNWDADDDDVRAAKQSAIPPSLPPLSLPAPEPAVSLSGLPARRPSSSKGSGSFEARPGNQKPAAGDAVVQWLRPVRNLRRAIVVATILGPPKQ